MSLETCLEVTFNKPLFKGVKHCLAYISPINGLICGSNTEIRKVNVSFSVSNHEILLEVRERCSSLLFLLKQRAVAPGGV